MANQKGGTAKSFLSLILGVVLNEQNKSVEMIDLDPQGSLSDMAEMIDLPSIKGSKHVIIDTPPTLFNKATVRHIKNCDLVVIPTSPSITDIRVTLETIPLIKSYNEKVIVVLNKIIKANKAGKTIEDIKDYIRSECSVKVANSHILNRTCYQHDFLTEGYKGLNRDAKNEVNSLVLELLG